MAKTAGLREFGTDPDDEVLAALIERCERDHFAWVNGDPSGYDMARPDGIVVGAFGGAASGATLTAGRQAAASLFESGSGAVELLDGGRGGSFAWLVMIERFSGDADMRRWELRVTEVFQRDGENCVGSIGMPTRASNVTASPAFSPSSIESPPLRSAVNQSHPSDRGPRAAPRAVSRSPDA